MDTTLIILQVVNITLSTVMPVISTFLGRITHSKCFSCIEIERRLIRHNSHRNNRNNNNENNNENNNDV